MQAEVNVINAFTKEGKGGNPAAVVLDADRFSAAQKQAIAAEAGLSETAFVGHSDAADFKLDFFTPVRQIAHCGHATIAAFSYLKQTGKIKGVVSSKMTVDGRREIRFVGEEAFMEQTAPRFFALNEEDEAAVSDALNLAENETLSPSPVIVNTGNSFIILEVRDEAVLQNLRPRFDGIAKLSEKHGLVGFYVFAKPANTDVDATARMFAPAYGIEEEAATGMAAGPLACHLFRFGSRKTAYRIEQGRFMKTPSPSLIKVDLAVEGNDVKGLYAGGSATLVDKKVIEC